MPLLALSRLSTRTAGNRLLVHYLTERDHPWLRALLDEYQRGIGKKRSEILSHLREPLPVRAPKFKQLAAVQVLESLSRARVVAAVPPLQARLELFSAAASSSLPRRELVQSVAERLGTQAASLEAALFADLKSEAIASSLPAALSPADLAGEVNLKLVSSWIQRARTLRITAWGNARGLVRNARRHGLICNVRPAPTSSRAPETRRPEYGPPAPESTREGVALEVSGPLALFRQTLVYGRALSALLPHALRCAQFELVALCEAAPGALPMTLVVSSGDPVRAAAEPPQLSSRLEQRFERDFRRAAPDWHLTREPYPLTSGSSLTFADFELVHRHHPTRRFLLEVVGFWTARYIEEKLRELQAARVENVILCVDEARACSEDAAPQHARIVRFRRHIEPAAVLAALDAAAP